MAIILRPTSSGGGTTTTLAEMKRAAWVPTGVTDESFARSAVSNTVLTMTTGQLRVTGRLLVPSGRTVSAVWCHFAGNSTAITNAWAALVRQSDLAVLAKSADNGATAITAGIRSWALTWASGADTPVYVGLVQVGTGLASVAGQTAFGALTAVAPAEAGTSTTGLTDPASLGATAAAVAASNPTPWVGITYA